MLIGVVIWNHKPGSKSPIKPSLGAVITPSPFLNGIDVPQEQEDLPRSAALLLLPFREEQVVAGDAQGASGRRVERLTEHNILHIGGLDVLRKLHPAAGEMNPVSSLLQEWLCPPLQITSSPAEEPERMKVITSLQTVARCLFDDKASINSFTFFFCQT